MSEYIGKHEKIDVGSLKDALSGACFHGEVWIRCPYCKKGIEIVGLKPYRQSREYRIFRCECGELFRDRK